MRKVMPALLAAIVLAGPAAARAEQATWEVQGHVASSQGAALAAFQPGDSFRALVNFDAAATPASTQNFAGGGARYNYPGDPLTFDIFIGSFGPFHVQFASGPGNDGGIFLRDNAPVPAPNGSPVDGYTFFLTSFDPNDGGVSTNVQVLMRGPTLDIVNGPALAATPDRRLATLPTAIFQVCRSSQAAPGSCDLGFLDGDIESVFTPAYGTGYLFTARDCRVVQTNPINVDPLPSDCANTNQARYQLWSYPAPGMLGGGLGFGEFSQSYAPADTDIDPMWGSTSHASLNLPTASLGNLFGAVSFGGPAAFPIVRGSTSPSDISRVNSNLFGYQKYTYSGAGTPLPLVVDLTYNIGDYNVDPGVSGQIGLRPGGAEISVVMSVIDGSISMNQVRDAGIQGFNTLTCGGEPAGWPAGSILGTASFDNPEHQVGQHEAVFALQSCAAPGQPVQLSVGQSFVVATSMQIPARGKAAQSPATVSAPTNGYVDAANTLRVTFAPDAPPALVQALADSIKPACTDCDFSPAPLDVAIKLNPGETDGSACISLRGKGNVNVAMLGSAHFNVKDVRLDDSLRFGTLAARFNKGKANCSVSQVNGDGYDDLVCNFPNSPDSWQPGQTFATLTGKLFNGVPIQGSVPICLKK
jgi:hypothetical protein